MRLGIIGDEISQDLDEVARLCVRHGYEGVEIRSVWGRSPAELDRNDCRRIRGTLDAAGLRVANFATPAFKDAIPRTAADRARVREVLERSMERAAWLGAPYARVFSFYHGGTPDPAAAAAEMREALAGCAPPPGCTLLLENGMRTNNPDAENTAQLLQGLKGAPLGVLWDPGNTWFSGWDRRHFTAAYDLLKDHIRYVHVKDPIGSDRYVRLGDGEVDWRGIVDRLARDGFGGWISLETHWRLDRVLSQPERDTPHGKSFSAGGYEASSQCMALLAEMVRGAGE